MRSRSLLLVLGLPLGGCAANATGPVDPVAENEPARSRDAGGGPIIRAEVGALDEAAVKQVFRAAVPRIEACFRAGSKRHAYLEGEIEVLLRIRGDGRVRYALPVGSSFGDRETERCILDELGRERWPEPQGGDEGETRQKFEVGAAGRPAVAWSPAQLGSRLGELQRKLRRCQANVGTSGLSVTIHVDPDGKPVTAGAAVSDERGLGALDCALDAATSLRYPSPGSWPAKVTVTAD
jgi:hypothetical protein